MTEKEEKAQTEKNRRKAKGKQRVKEKVIRRG
jgi:hypothetical protein